MLGLVNDENDSQKLQHKQTGKFGNDFPIDKVSPIRSYGVEEEEPFSQHKIGYTRSPSQCGSPDLSVDEGVKASNTR